MALNHTDPYEFRREDLPQIIADNIIRTETFHYQNASYTFGRFRHEIAPIHFGVGMPSGQNLFAADDIPEDLLPSYLAHEIVCNRQRPGEEGGCKRTEMEVLVRAQNELLKRLMQHRRLTFEDLVNLYAIDVEKPKPGLHAEIAGTTRWLRRFMQEQGIPLLELPEAT